MKKYNALRTSPQSLDPGNLSLVLTILLSLASCLFYGMGAYLAAYQ